MLSSVVVISTLRVYFKCTSYKYANLPLKMAILFSSLISLSVCTEQGHSRAVCQLPRGNDGGDVSPG